MSVVITRDAAKGGITEPPVDEEDKGKANALSLGAMEQVELDGRRHGRIVVLDSQRKGDPDMTTKRKRAKRVSESRSPLETDLQDLFDRHADHSIIREALDRMAVAQAQTLYSTYPACQSNA